jgi:chemotaxis protein methyltransferase CheR
MSEPDIMLASAASHVIFCRNVFIYFSDCAAQKTVRAFSQTMPKPGYLFVGMAESLMNIRSDFELREVGDAFVHIKSC